MEVRTKTVGATVADLREFVPVGQPNVHMPKLTSPSALAKSQTVTEIAICRLANCLASQQDSRKLGHAHAFPGDGHCRYRQI